MRFLSFKYENNLITSEKKINSILLDNNLDWILESEFDEASIEVRNKTIIWNSGTWIWGNWYYGIWENGIWIDGVWENGIWIDGEFRGGTMKSGVFKGGKISGGVVLIKNS